MKRIYYKKQLNETQVELLEKHISQSYFIQPLELGKIAYIGCSIIFIDLCNFTNISWTLKNEETMQILQPLFRFVSKNISFKNGMVDKYPGDGVVVFFPSNFFSNDNLMIDYAIDSSTEIIYWFYNTFRNNFDLPKTSHSLELSIGIDGGYISIAHVGSEYHSELILLGSQVNCASKCQEIGEKREIIIGQEGLDLAHYKNLYSNYISTGPHTGIVYTKDNSPYKAYRFDWEEYAKNSWISKNLEY